MAATAATTIAITFSTIMADSTMLRVIPSTKLAFVSPFKFVVSSICFSFISYAVKGSFNGAKRKKLYACSPYSSAP